jgi:exonuclease VII small subunit
MPTWDEEAKRRQTRYMLVGITILVIAAWVAIIFWIIKAPPGAEAAAITGNNLTIILAPILAAATGVERSLETFFNIVENSFKTMVAYLGKGLRWLKNSEIEVQQARQWLADVSTRYAEEMQTLQVQGLSVQQVTREMQSKMTEANAMMALAQQRLEAAEANLADLSDSDAYRNVKAAASIILGLMLGVIVAQVASLQMFALMGVPVVPVKFDIFITGLIIGSGSYPVHSLVGILQQGKDTLDSVKGYFNRAAPIAQAVQQKITTVQSSEDTGEPIVKQAVIETTTEKTTDEGPHK